MNTVTKADIDKFTAKGLKFYINNVLVTGNATLKGTLKFVANSNTVINSAKIRDWDGFDKNFTISSDKKTATFTTDNGTEYEVPTVATSSTSAPPVDPYLNAVKQSDIDNYTAKNAVLYVNDVIAKDGTKLTGVLKFVANSGYLIENAVIRDLDGFSNNFVLAGDSKSATFTTVTGTQYSAPTISTVMETKEVKGLNAVYELTADLLRTFTAKRFVGFDGQNATDYGRYILGLIELPFKVPSQYVKGKQNIQLGGYDTGVNADLLSIDKITLDLGEINIPLKFNNSLDFQNVTGVLYLPYSPPITIEPKYFVGQKLRVEYIINMYNGECIINIYSTKTDGVIIRQNIDLNIAIPFAQIETNPTINSPSNIKIGGYNGLKQPYIEVLRNDVILSNGFFTIPVLDEKPLQGEKGFIQVNEVNLQVNATDSERENIISLLNKGVIIK